MTPPKALDPNPAAALVELGGPKRRSVSKPTTQQAQPLAGGWPSSRQVLIVEDDGAYNRLLVSFLQARGFSVIACDSAACALTQLSQGLFAGAIVDLSLPDMSGIQLIQQIRNLAQQRQLPIIAVSAYGEDFDVLWLQQIGATAYFAKPLVLQQLAAELERLLGYSA